MHTPTLILLALGTLALAIPTNNNNNNNNNNTITAHPIQKRNSRPWIQEFDYDDVPCQNTAGANGDDNDNRPFIVSGDCEPFNPATGRVGGSWGAGKGDEISIFTAYENDDCTGAVKAIISRHNDEAGFCFTLDTLGCVDGEDVGNPCFWLSVRGS